MMENCTSKTKQLPDGQQPQLGVCITLMEWKLVSPYLVGNFREIYPWKQARWGSFDVPKLEFSMRNQKKTV